MPRLVADVRPSVHFWTLRHGPEIAMWDPDAEPGKHLSGFGHTFLELFVRLRRAGHPVTIGRSVPRGRGAVVACLEELTEWDRHGVPRNNLALCLDMLTKGRRALVVIRNDVHPHIRPPVCTSLEIMPTAASVDHPSRQKMLPLLPQRGLQQRDTTRRPQIETVGLKAYRVNTPTWFTELADRLWQKDINLRLDDGEVTS